MTEASPLALFPPVIDNTMRSDFVLCPHKWFRRHCQGLHSTEALNIHQHFGGCFARGLEASRKAFYISGRSATEAILDGSKAILKEWGDYEMPDLPAPANLKTLGACIDALWSYFTTYPLDTDRLRALDIGHGPMVEVSFAVPIPGTCHPQSGEPIVYSGRFDMVGTIAGGCWVCDEKTASSLGDKWADQWQLDAQPTGYCWGLRQYGLHPIGAIIRGVGILSQKITFAEALTEQAPWKIDRWQRQLKNDVNAMCRMWNKYTRLTAEFGRVNDNEGLFPRSLDKHACHAYNHDCSFIPLCTSPEPDRWLSHYVVDRWNPLERRE